MSNAKAPKPPPTATLCAIAQEMAGFAFFRSFPTEFVAAFARLAIAHEFAPGEALLEQGKSNSSLFFLRAGRLRVEVDGEPVAILATVGDVVGEMSLINRAPVAASVRAADRVSTFEVSEERLATMPAGERESCQALLDRVYASVLADRLARTNEKAKGFEIANRELSKAQERLKRINESLEAELGRRSREMVRKVRDLTESRLRPAHARLAKWSQAPASAPAAAEIRETLGDVAETIALLMPIADLSGSEENETARAMLLLDRSKKQQNIARLALGGSGVDLSLASTPEEFDALLASRAYDAIVCDGEFLESAAKAAAAQPKARLVLMMGLDMSAYLKALEAFPKDAFFVSRDPEDRSFTIRGISSTANKIVNQNIFGLEKHLSSSARLLELPVRSSAERAGLIDEMAAHFKALGVREALLDRMRIAAEELLMNAIYDAPVDSDGKSLYNHLPRTQAVELRPDHQATLRYGTDGLLVGISVSDPFGSLTRSTIRKYLESCAQGRAGELNVGKGGAGRGLKMLIDSADVTIFNVVAKRKTEVISLFDLERAAAGDATPAFHLYCID